MSTIERGGFYMLGINVVRTTGGVMDEQRYRIKKAYC
jgi:hypothetical protein